MSARHHLVGALLQICNVVRCALIHQAHTNAHVVKGIEIIQMEPAEVWQIYTPSSPIQWCGVGSCIL